MRFRHATPGLLLAAIIGIVFGASLAGEFVWDDRPLIADNPMIRDLDSIGQLLTSSFWETGDRHDRFRSFFRPVVSASYAADYALWGLEPLGFRITNLLLHAICCLLVFRLALGEGLDRRASLIGAAIFAAHPVHTESVAWISGRTDLMCALFFLLAFHAYRRTATSSLPRPWRAASLVCFALALFAKEMAATLPFLIAADRMLTPAGAGVADTGTPLRRGLRSLTAVAPYLFVFGLYVVARHVALGQESAPLYHLSPGSHLATTLFVVGRYVTLLLVPLGLDAHYPYEPLTSLASLLVLVSATILAVIAWTAWRARRRSPSTSFWILWTFITLLPVLAFGRFGDVLMADRFLYIPSVGLALLAARYFSVWLRLDVRRRMPALVTASCAVVVLAVPCGVRAMVWTDDQALFTNMARTSPASAMVRCNLGLAYYNKGDFKAATEEFRLAIQLLPTYAMAYNNLAAALEREGRLEEALVAYEVALQLAPRERASVVNRASLRVRLGQEERGLKELRDVVDAYPNFTPAIYTYADALEQVGRTDEALTWARRALDVDPGYPNAHYLVGKVLAQRGESGEAAAAMRRFLDLWPDEGVYAQAARRVISGAEAAPPPR